MTSATSRPAPAAPSPAQLGARPRPAPPAGTPVRVTGAQSLVRSLEAVGVEVVFGIPGGTILPAYDPLLDSTKVRHVLVRHEQGAGHAATGDAAARLPADHAPARQAGARGGPADRAGAAAGALRRRRRDQGRCPRAAGGTGPAERDSGRDHADGPWRLPRLEPPAPGHAGHA